LAAEGKNVTIIYQIQTMVVNINAETVTQLNTNPEHVVNMIKDQVNAEIEKLEINDGRSLRAEG
jgi:hypothetical protein